MRNPKTQWFWPSHFFSNLSLSFLLRLANLKDSVPGPVPLRLVDLLGGTKLEMSNCKASMARLASRTCTEDPKKTATTFRKVGVTTGDIKYEKLATWETGPRKSQELRLKNESSPSRSGMGTFKVAKLEL